jgi:hypothetical protein
VFYHKIAERLAKNISTLAAEADVLQPGERNQFNEDREAINAELALLKEMAEMIERFTQKRMRLAIDRMERSQKDGL